MSNLNCAAGRPVCRLSVIFSLTAILLTGFGMPAIAEITFLNTWGSAGSGNGQFNDPRDVAVSGTGLVYVADRLNSRIQRFDSDGTYQTQWGSFGGGNGRYVTKPE